MSSIPVDVLLNILEHVGKADLITLCQVNKICSSYSQDILYREISARSTHTDVIQTLARSTHLARRVRSFVTYINHPELAEALQNMTSLRNLSFLDSRVDSTCLDGCTFKLDSFTVCSYDESLRKFLHSQPSLTTVNFCVPSPNVPEFETTCLPNLTHVTAWFNWLPNIIPGRPVSEVISRGFSRRRASVDVLSFFTLSTAPILKLTIDYSDLYPIPGPTLASIFSSLTHLTMIIAEPKLQRVRGPLYYSSNNSISSKCVTGL
jgi:F-box domain